MPSVMRSISSSHVFSCDSDTFWKAFFDEAYGRALYLEELQFRSFAVLEQTPTTRRMRITPKMNLPGPVEKLLGDSFAYEEQGTFDKAKNVFHWKMVPSALKDKLFTSGTITVEPAGEGKVKRTDSVSIEAKVFAVGGLIEQSAEKEMRAGWEKERKFLERWLLKG
jgi:hypothetical protein